MPIQDPVILKRIADAVNSKNIKELDAAFGTQIDIKGLSPLEITKRCFLFACAEGFHLAVQVYANHLQNDADTIVAGFEIAGNKQQFDVVAVLTTMVTKHFSANNAGTKTSAGPMVTGTSILPQVNPAQIKQPAQASSPIPIKPQDKPLSKEASQILAKYNCADAAVFNSLGDVEDALIKEMCSKLTFKWYNSVDDNIFQAILKCFKFDIANHILSIFPQEVNSTNRHNQTSLHIFCKWDNAVSNGVKMMASFSGRGGKTDEAYILELVEFLLKNNATVNLQDKYNLTPIQYAKSNKFEKVAAKLVQYAKLQKNAGDSAKAQPALPKNSPASAAPANQSSVLQRPSEIVYKPAASVGSTATAQPSAVSSPVYSNNNSQTLYSAQQQAPAPAPAASPSTTNSTVFLQPPETANTQEYDRLRKQQESGGILGRFKNVFSGSGKNDGARQIKRM